MDKTKTKQTNGSSSQELQTAIAGIERLREKYPNSEFSFEDIQSAEPSIPKELIPAALQRLAKKLIIQQLQDSKGRPLFKFNVKSANVKFADETERAVYRAVTVRGAAGIASKDIRRTIGDAFSNDHIKKALNRLLKEKHIKKVTPGTGQVYYLLYSVTPEGHLRESPFYAEGEAGRIDVTFVSALSDMVEKRLQEHAAEVSAKGLAPLETMTRKRLTVREVTKYLRDRNISKVPLEEKDVAELLASLALRDRAVACSGGDNYPMYRAAGQWVDTPGSVGTLCGLCPYVSRCRDIGSVTVSSCQYWDDWQDNF